MILIGIGWKLMIDKGSCGLVRIHSVFSCLCFFYLEQHMQMNSVTPQTNDQPEEQGNI